MGFFVANDQHSNSGKSGKKDAFFGLFSVIFHLLVVGIYPFLVNRDDAPPEKAPIQVQRVASSEVQKILEEMEKSKRRASANKQIVNAGEKGRDKRPETERFLGKRNQVHDRQTIARRVDRYNRGGQGRPDGVRQASGEKAARAAKATNKANKKVKSLKQLSMVGGQDFSMAQSAKGTPQEGRGKKQGHRFGDSAGKGVASNNDFIEDIPLGDTTQLNTVEFKYYGFYHRIRQKLEQYWGKSLKDQAQRLYKQGRRLPANENHITSVVLRLDAKGNIVTVKVSATSGFQELDEAAIQSFNQAGPFPNPPSGMLNEEGKAEIKWGFVVRS